MRGAPLSNLDTAIRAYLELIESPLVAAIINVLDEHVHIRKDGVLLTPGGWSEEVKELYEVYSIYGGDRDFGCTRCHYYSQGAVHGYGWCRTVKAIAQPLGIEVDDDL